MNISTSETPSFIEAPVDIEVNEGDDIRLPCRAQGRPRTRVIWDRVGFGALPLANNEGVSKYLDDESQENLIAMAKIMSLRSKREQNSSELLRFERETKEDTPILFFSTPSPTSAPGLEVNDADELILRDVSQKHTGWYACAALNEAGSIVKRVFVRVINPSEPGSNIPEPPGSRWGSEQTVSISSVSASSANSLDVTWETTEGIPSTTLTLHYRIVGSKDFLTTTEMIDTNEFSIGELRAHTEYEIFATVPHGLSGSVSNIRIGKTIDGPPNAPPTDVRIGVINSTAAYVRWASPPNEQLNGVLIGYKVNRFAHNFHNFHL